MQFGSVLICSRFCHTGCQCSDMHLIFVMLDVREPEEIADLLNQSDRRDRFARFYRAAQLLGARIDGFHGFRMVMY